MRQWRWMILLAVLAMVVAACGGAADETTTTTAAGETTTTAAGETTTTAPPMDGEEVTLRWRTRPDNAEEAAVYQAVSDELDAGLEGITLQYEPGGTETAGYQQNLLTELSAGTAPDVFWIPGTDVADFATKGVILDLRSLADATGHQDSDFYEGPMFHLAYNPETGNSGDVLWGLPRDVSTFALYLNLDLIAEAGVPDPRELSAAGEWTWDAFNEVVDGIAALGGEIRGYGQSAWWGPYGAWMNGSGGGFFTDDRTACGLDSDETIAGLTFLRDLYATGDVVPWGEDPEAPFRAGTLGMFQNGRWATPGIRTVDFEWDVVELPAGSEGPGNWLFWGAYVVNADTEHPEEAWALVQALTQAEIQAQVAELGANIPSRVSQEALDAFLTFTPPANNQAFLDGLAEEPTTEGPLWAGSWPEFVSLMDAEIGAVVTGARDIADFQANICSETAAAFSG
ncbi:MAG: sugar ABC transporter substrate-binding protein [Acidimicrobiia bacterium]|jgi:multiple sugar transport system substrate-binding protein